MLLTFRTRKVWELIYDVFSMWDKIGIKNKKDKMSKPLICGNNKSGPEMKQLLEDMTIIPWRELQGLKDKKHSKAILSHVKSSELSLDEMYEEFQK